MIQIPSYPVERWIASCCALYKQVGRSFTKSRLPSAALVHDWCTDRAPGQCPVSRSKRSRPARKRVGRVSYYQHHGAWHSYYREGERQVRRRVAETEADAARVAVQVNAQLHAAPPTLLAFTPVTIPELRRRFLDHHEHVQRSSLARIDRYR